jgi:hypothetical protein
MSDEEFSAINSIRNYYDKINQKIREIKAKIYKQEGWLFVNHIYSKEDLINDSAFNTIDGIINNLSANVESWGKNNGGYSMPFYTEYHRIKDNIDLNLKQLEDEIKKRQPTSWEKLKEGFAGVVAYLLSKLPNIVLRVLGLPDFIQRKRLD